MDINYINDKLESLLQKATNGGGFSCLSELEKEKLIALSAAMEHHEDEVLKIMPLKTET